MPIRKIENPDQFRSNIRKKLEEFFETKDAINLEKGINETIDWFINSENLTSYKSSIYNI